MLVINTYILAQIYNMTVEWSRALFWMPHNKENDNSFTAIPHQVFQSYNLYSKRFNFQSILNYQLFQNSCHVFKFKFLKFNFSNTEYKWSILSSEGPVDFTELFFNPSDRSVNYTQLALTLENCILFTQHI
jgi:hypothetical protein